jgi:Polyketide cyclase / dehydrase and lipid transport
MTKLTLSRASARPRADLSRPLTAVIDIAASPDAVWAVVSDPGRTGEWSPECARVVPFGSPGVGRLMLGMNHRRAVWWITLSRVTAYQVEHEIAWVVLTNRARWGYRLESTEAGTRLTHTRRTPRGVAPLATWFANHCLGGMRSHDDELEEGMHAGLRRIKELAELHEQIDL